MALLDAILAGLAAGAGAAAGPPGGFGAAAEGSGGGGGALTDLCARLCREWLVWAQKQNLDGEAGERGCVVSTFDGKQVQPGMRIRGPEPGGGRASYGCLHLLRRFAAAYCAKCSAPPTPTHPTDHLPSASASASLSFNPLPYPRERQRGVAAAAPGGQAGAARPGSTAGAPATKEECWAQGGHSVLGWTWWLPAQIMHPLMLPGLQVNSVWPVSGCRVPPRR